MTDGNSEPPLKDGLSDEISERKKRLAKELTRVRDRERSLAQSSYIWSQFLFILALLCSVAAAVMGLFFTISARIVGGVAALTRSSLL